MENKVDKLGNKCFKTVNYRSIPIDFYDDDNGQRVYFYYKDKLYNCGTYNLDYENEMHYIVDCDLDYVAEVRCGDNVTIIYRKKNELHTYWFHCKGGAEKPIITGSDLEDVITQAKIDLERFNEFINSRHKW
jgi:hypothetical protein